MMRIEPISSVIFSIPSMPVSPIRRKKNSKKVEKTGSSSEISFLKAVRNEIENEIRLEYENKYNADISIAKEQEQNLSPEEYREQQIKYIRMCYNRLITLCDSFEQNEQDKN